MSIYFVHRTTFSAAALSHGAGIACLETAVVGGEARLYAGSQADGGLTAFHLSQGSAAVLGSTLTGSSGTGTWGITDLAPVALGSGQYLAPAGGYADVFAFTRLNATGDITGFSRIPTIARPTDSITEIEVSTLAGTTFMVTGRDGAGGLDVFQMAANLSISYVGSIGDSASRLLGNISDLALQKIGGTTFAFAASSVENGITSLILSPGGGLSVVDTVDGAKGIGMSQPHTLEVVAGPTDSFLLAGGAQSDTISVFRIGPDGGLSLRDTVWDSRDTRFAGVTAIDSFALAGRSFVAAGGSDGGVTLFELAPDGHLGVLTSLGDTAAMTLASVSALRVAIVGSEVQVFVASASEAGLTQLTLNMGGIAPVIAASAGTATGGAGDDLIMGTDGRDSLAGGAGDDRIHDGAGVDILTGGSGADTFVIAQDGSYDRITDYDPLWDRIDFSHFGSVHAMAGLQIDPTAYGARILIGTEALLLSTADGHMLTAADFTAGDFLFA